MVSAKYFRLTRAERGAIEHALDKHTSARQIAKDLGRSPSSIADEVKRNRTISKGAERGMRVHAVPAEACPKLQSWPHVCNGCRYRRYHCSYKWRCEYSAVRAQSLSEELSRTARRGIDMDEVRFEKITEAIRYDLARGLSPAQIASARQDEFKIATSTIYRWIAAGYAGMSNMDLRHQVGYKQRKRSTEKRPTSHGPSRSYAAFLNLESEKRDSAVEMDCVIGRAKDTQCILTLYHRPTKLQLALLLPEKTSSAVAAALDAVEGLLGKDSFRKIFGIVLTDNGMEFSDYTSLERSCFPGKISRCKVYYCDIRQSQQKAGCERNHVELRKILPKRQGIPFDNLTEKDMAVLMSHLNSEPRASLANLDAMTMFKAAYRQTADTLLDGLGINHIAYDDLNMTIEALNQARKSRGDDPII